MKKTIKTILLYLSKIKQWHRYPLPKNIKILSLYEVILYLIFFIISIVIYNGIQIIPVHHDEIELLRVYADDNDTTDYAFKIEYKIPMSFIFEESDGLGKINCRVYHSPDSTKYIGSYFKRDSLFAIYKSFDEERFQFENRSLSYLKVSQKHTLFKQAIKFVEKPWHREINGRIMAVSRHTYDNGAYIAECIFPNLINIGPSITDAKTGPLSRPRWYSLYDISQSYFDIKIDTDYKEGIICFDFVGATEFSKIDPEPDVVSMSSIIYKDKDKIRELKEKGLKFHVKHVELQNFQNSRLFFITALMGALFAIFITFFVLAMYKISRSIKKTINETRMSNDNNSHTE